MNGVSPGEQYPHVASFDIETPDEGSVSDRTLWRQVDVRDIDAVSNFIDKVDSTIPIEVTVNLAAVYTDPNLPLAPLTSGSESGSSGQSQTDLLDRPRSLPPPIQTGSGYIVKESSLAGGYESAETGRHYSP